MKRWLWTKAFQVTCLFIEVSTWMTQGILYLIDPGYEDWKKDQENETKSDR